LIAFFLNSFHTFEERIYTLNKSIFILLLIFTISCKNKNGNIDKSVKSDSLFYFLDIADRDTVSYELRNKFNDKAFEIISKKSNDSLNRVYHFKVAARYYNINEIEKYKYVTKKIIDASVQKNDSSSLAKAYSFLGDYYSYKFISDSAYSYYLKAEKIYKILHDDIKTAKALLNKGILQYNEGDYSGSEISCIKALKYLRNSNEDLIVYEANNVLGTIYGEINEYDKAIEYHLKAIKIAENSNIYDGYHAKSTSLNNLGYSYKNMNNHYEAIKKFKIALLDKNIFYEKTNLYAALKDNLAYSQFKTGNLKDLPKLFYESLKIRDSLKIIPGLIISKLHLSEYYTFKNDTSKALSFAKQSYETAKENNLSKDVLLCLKQLSVVNPQKIDLYSSEYIRVNDSLQLAERKIRNKLGRIEFETEEITIEKDKLKEQQKTMIYIGLGVFLIGVFIFVIRFQAAKNRELLLVQEQQKANEEIYQLMLNQQNKIEEVRQSEKKRIAQELHDGVLGKLFGTRMNLGVLNNKNDEKAVASRVVFIDELKTLEQEIREISHDLNSEKTAVFNNFVVMVTHFFETQKTVCTAVITFAMDPKIEWNWVDNMAKINFYRILQEAFQNINKHANAQNVSATFTKVNDLIQLEIKDDGIGFNYARKKKGIGLQNMNSRINNSGGNMQIETEIGSGTLLKFELPLIAIKTINLIPNEKDNPVVNGR
jgi:signal transduction histidine kinase